MVKNYLELTGIYQKKIFLQENNYHWHVGAHLSKARNLKLKERLTIFQKKTLSVFYGNAFEKAKKNCGQFTSENYRQKSLYLHF